MNINTLFSGKNTARQRLGTKAPMRFQLSSILHILPSLTLIHLRLVSRYFQHHMNLNHPLWISTIRGSGFPLPGDISRIPYMFDGSPSFMFFWSGSKEDLQEPAKKWWGTPWFPIDFPWISRHWWPFCAPQTTSSGRFTQLPLAPHGADQRCLTPVVSTILSHVMLVAFADSIHS